MTSTIRRPGVSGLDRFFSITERGSTVPTEVRGGVTTYFTMIYIVVLNPIILTGANALVEIGEPLDFVQVAAMTAVVGGVLSILMGLIGRLPIPLAAGLGLNGVVAYTLAPQMGWKGAMGIVVLEGLLTLVLVLTRVRLAVFDAVPSELKYAIAVGIGLFITLIGLVDAGFVRRIPGDTGTVPLGLGINNQLDGWPVVVFVVTLLIMVVLDQRNVKGALLIGIVAGTVGSIVLESFVDVGPALGDPASTGWALNVPKLPDGVTAMPDLGLFGQFSISQAVNGVGLLAVVVYMLSINMADFFDTSGTMTAVSEQAGLLDENDRPPRAQQALIVDSLGAVAGGVTSVSSNTCYAEATAGVSDGARTGLASVVTGLCFLASAFVVPLVSIIPSEAAAPALVLVGFKMMQQITKINWQGIYAWPSFLAIVMMPFTYSITVGIGLSFIALVVVKVCKGRASEVHPFIWGVSLLFVAYFALTPIERVLGIA